MRHLATRSSTQTAGTRLVTAAGPGWMTCSLAATAPRQSVTRGPSMSIYDTRHKPAAGSPGSAAQPATPSRRPRPQRSRPQASCHCPMPLPPDLQEFRPASPQCAEEASQTLHCNSLVLSARPESGGGNRAVTNVSPRNETWRVRRIMEGRVSKAMDRILRPLPCRGEDAVPHPSRLDKPCPGPSNPGSCTEKKGGK